MCSIAGINIKSEKIVKKMIDIQRHRAPDDEGYICFENLSLGMGRLEIIDLVSKGLCPYQEDQFVLCYNGEIYNFVELRNQLKKKWKFYTTSDTEVLLKSWREWGTKMFSKLNGMFSFCIYDKKKQTLILARDIAGEKPLYYFNKGKRFAFASELKALSNVLDLKLEKKIDFFTNFQHCHNETLWKNTFQIPPAHYLHYNLKTNKMKLEEYWIFKKKKINLKTVDEEFENLLNKSLKIRLRSDVPVGIYQSDGLDSNILAKLHRFNHRFYFDDSKDWKEDFFKNIKKIAYHLDTPVGSLSSYPLYKLAEKASKKVKVIISGEGADELFGGYVRYLPIAFKFRLPEFLSGFWIISKFAALMPVPVASINKNSCSILFKHYIWFSRELFGMKPEPESLFVQKRANKDLWFCI